ncbi:hypothetical protein FQZ97_1179850 [compost metagenome]
MFGQKPAKQRDDMRAQSLLFPPAIGEAGIVGDIDEMPLRHQHSRLAQHREPADAAVEDENGFQVSRCHRCLILSCWARPLRYRQERRNPGDVRAKTDRATRSRRAAPGFPFR